MQHVTGEFKKSLLAEEAAFVKDGSQKASFLLSHNIDYKRTTHSIHLIHSISLKILARSAVSKLILVPAQDAA